LIVRLGLMDVYEAEVDLLPDPDLFRDALLLSQSMGWPASSRDLDETDALVLALVRRLRNVKRKKG
jgi:hypothetical protein